MIFRRKKPSAAGGGEAPGEDPASILEAGNPPIKPFVRPAGVDGLARPLGAAPKMPVPPAVRTDAPRRVIDIPTAPRRSERTAAAAGGPTEGKRLIVGREICLSGQISACERLVVEGRVEAELTDCQAIEIADHGSFKGSAEVDSAEISGRFEGSLTVHERLLIRNAGQVSGTVRYGRLEIEEGGEINGDVRSLGAGESQPARANLGED
jgi:cytoskeletal protein CcmA (bactofilin family)